MRWKLLVPVSTGSAFVAFCVWEVIVHVIFGPIRPVPRREWLLLASACIPLLFAAFSAFFVYRHTARRRKTQAVISLVLTGILVAGIYLAGSKLFPQAIAIPRPCDHPCD